MPSARHLAVTTAVMSAPALAQPSYTAQLLPPLVPFGDVTVQAVTNTGLPVGVAFDDKSYRPVRWVGGVPEPLTVGPQSAAYYWTNGHSGDTLVGHMRIGDDDYAFRWMPGQGLQPIMTAAGGSTSSAAYGINSAGVVAGQIALKAVRWTAGGGATIIEFPGTPGPVNYGNAEEINDAGVVVGFAGHPAGPIPVDGIQAFRWTQAGGIERLVTLGGSNSWASDVNASGDIVGTAATGDQPEDPEKGFLWKNGVITVLGQITDPMPSNAIAINDAGEILGFDGFAFGGTPESWIWISGVKHLLGDVTTLPTGWRIEQVHDLNNAGTIAATLINDSTFERSPALLVRDSCYADCNASGSLTIADFACFQAKFAAADPYADCNQSGGLTITDFACFQAAFVAGCP